MRALLLLYVVLCLFVHHWSDAETISSIGAPSSVIAIHYFWYRDINYLRVFALRTILSIILSAQECPRVSKTEEGV